MHDGLIIPLFGIFLPMFLVPTIITLTHRQKKREWRHLERLRALELGLPVPQAEHALGGGSVVAIGAGVPVVSVIGALIASSSVPYSTPDYMPILAVIWGCAVLISSGALVTSLVLGFMVMRSRKPAATDQFAALKPAYEPDAYDVVSRRG
jgi:hypothetical protein